MLGVVDGEKKRGDASCHKLPTVRTFCINEEYMNKAKQHIGKAGQVRVFSCSNSPHTSFISSSRLDGRVSCPCKFVDVVAEFREHSCSLSVYLFIFQNIVSLKI